MKVSQLIKELTELDPSDECEICINNHPVSSVSRMPYYWDGRLEEVIRDHRHIPTKVGYPNHGSKIKIHFDTIEDALLDNPDAELDLSGITYQGKVEEGRMKDIEEWIRQGREFQEWKKTDLLAIESGKGFRKLQKKRLKARFTSLLRRLSIIE